MTKLTQEQRQTIEDALNSIPKSIKNENFGTMEGIEKQLAQGSTLIFYMSSDEPGGLTIHKMKVGEND